MIVALILARGNSRRLKGKNLLRIGPYSLLERAIRVAQESPSIEHIYLSTDSLAIAHEGMAMDHAHKPYSLIWRPPRLAATETTSEEAAYHAIAEAGLSLDDWVVLLQPTSPFRTKEDVEKCIHAALERNLPAYTVTEGKTEPNGSVYMTRVDHLRNHSFTPQPAVTVTTPPERSTDIDTPEDFLRADAQYAKEAYGIGHDEDRRKPERMVAYTMHYTDSCPICGRSFLVTTEYGPTKKIVCAEHCSA